MGHNPDHDPASMVPAKPGPRSISLPAEREGKLDQLQDSCGATAAFARVAEPGSERPVRYRIGAIANPARQTSMVTDVESQGNLGTRG
eukprot:4283986-Amphidinium_carterae.1